MKRSIRPIFRQSKDHNAATDRALQSSRARCASRSSASSFDAYVPATIPTMSMTPAPARACSRRQGCVADVVARRSDAQLIVLPPSGLGKMLRWARRPKRKRPRQHKKGTPLGQNLTACKAEGGVRKNTVSARAAALRPYCLTPSRPRRGVSSRAAPRGPARRA
jgi:hypothetical protein